MVCGIKCPDVLSECVNLSDINSIHKYAIKCNFTMVVIGPKGIWDTIGTPSLLARDGLSY